jgi:putative transposase
MRDATTGPELWTLWEKNYSVYGRRKLWKAAKRRDIDVGRDQVARLMRQQGICGATRAKKRFTTKSDPGHVRAPDLVNRDFTALVLDALNMAAWTRRHTSLDGLICHTDAGSQYTSVLYTDRIDEVGAAPSIGTVGDSFDNAMAESVMGIFKTELHRNPAALATNGGPWRGLDDLEIATCGWVSWFNEERLHSELDDKTPEEFEAEYRQKSQPDAA